MSSRACSGGFSIVELMVALTLGLLVTGAVISVFVGSRSAYQTTSGVGALADGGRFALNFMQESGRGAGYLACNRATTTTSLNLLKTASSAFAYDFRYGVGGFEASGTAPGSSVSISSSPTADSSASDWSPSLDATFDGSVNKQVQNSDVLVIRSSVPRVTPVYLSSDASAGAASFQLTSASSLQSGQLAVISDCTKSVAFQIGSVTTGVPATLTLTGAAGPPGNASDAALPVAFSAGAVISPVTTTVYYIGVGADGDSALKRLEFVNGLVNGGAIFTDEELVADIENMQVLYGVDTTGSQTPSAFVTADQVTDFSTVVSIKVAVLAASPANLAAPPQIAPGSFNLLGTLISAPNDTRMRKVFDTTITVRGAVN